MIGTPITAQETLCLTSCYFEQNWNQFKILTTVLLSNLSQVLEVAFLLPVSIFFKKVSSSNCFSMFYYTVKYDNY